jgi:hypothetical protein
MKKTQKFLHKKSFSASFSFLARVTGSDDGVHAGNELELMRYNETASTSRSNLMFRFMGALQLGCLLFLRPHFNYHLQ